MFYLPSGHIRVIGGLKCLDLAIGRVAEKK